jgi:UDP-3-O-[3-hydroxymyristoyl] glucosamine N-acyltransferase
LIDDTLKPRACFSSDFPYPVLGGLLIFNLCSEIRWYWLLAIQRADWKLARLLKLRGCHFYSFVHPSCIVAANALIGEGVIIYPFCLISSNTRIADFVVINTHSGAGHDVQIGQGSVICAHVDLTGFVKIESVLVGSHASILPSVIVGDRAKVGAGSIVVRRIREDVTVYAQPARTLV